MLKIHQLFLRSFLAIFFVTLAILSVVVFYWAKNVHISQTQKAIITNINSIEVSLDNLDNIDEKLAHIKEKTNLRITIINKDGIVVGETHKDKSSMENHASRKEIIDAKYDGIGKVIRHSDTLDQDFLYVAKRIDVNGDIYYLLISENIDLLKKDFTKLTFQVIGIFSIFLLASILSSYLLSKKIQSETNLMLEYLGTLSSKRKLPKLEVPFTYEFHRMLTLLKKVASRIDKREKIKEKHLVKLDLANKQKDEIISAISHEFKNPIAVISGFVQTLQEDKHLPESMRKKFLDKIDMSATKMTNIIDRLRLSIKLDQNKEKLQVKNMELNKVIYQVIGELKDKYKMREIVFEADYSVYMDVDETLFSIALTNLIENGLKYSDDKVEVILYNNCISIKDYGVGIQQKDLENILKKFYRVSDNGWNNSLGLGLHIVHTIVRLHKFTLDVQSTYHEGSEFTIKFF